MKIALIGTGQMGKMVEQIAVGRGHEISVRLGGRDSAKNAADMSARLSGAEVAVDFSDASAVERNVEACLAAGISLVEGTTGWIDRLDDIKTLVVETDGSFVYGANFSIGVNLFFRITEFTAELFSRFSEYEAFIEEQHHSRKKDAPSGTALKLAEIVRKNVDNHVGVASTRAGNIPGTHRVGFDGKADQILLQHIASNRDCYAQGALLAAEWIVGKKPGLYGMNNVLGL